MAVYTVAAGQLAVHNKTLAANVVDAINFDVDPSAVEIQTDGAAEIYVSTDGSTPTVGGANTHLIPATAGSRFIRHGGDRGLRLISAGSPTYSVTKISAQDIAGADLAELRAQVDSLESSSAAGSSVDAPIPAPLDGVATVEPVFEHVWTLDDFVEFDGQLVYVLTWTPTLSGTAILAAPPWDGEGTTDQSGVTYRVSRTTSDDPPDTFQVAHSNWVYDTALGRALQAAQVFPVVAGDLYTLRVENNETEAAVGRTVSLMEWARAVQPFGGIDPLMEWRPEADGPFARAEGYATKAELFVGHAEGFASYADAAGSHAEGVYTRALGFASHAEGYYTAAHDNGAHAEGYNTLALGDSSHAEGANTTAISGYAHAEGLGTTASGNNSHTEGQDSVSSGTNSHAEGADTHAGGAGSHAEGSGTFAEAINSHAEGELAHARVQPGIVHARGGGSWTDTPGESQYVSIELREHTTDATPAPVAVRSAADRVVGMRGMVAARSTDGTLGAAWAFSAAARIATDGAVTIIGTPSVDLLGSDAGAAAWEVDIGEADDATLQVIVTGAAATDIHWSITAELKEVG